MNSLPVGTALFATCLRKTEQQQWLCIIPKFSEHEIVIDLMPEGTESVSETEEAVEAEERGTEIENTTEPESTPAFEFGLVAGLATAYRLKHRL